MVIKDSVSRQKDDGSDRPEKRRMATTYDYNKKVKKVDWFHPAFSLIYFCWFQVLLSEIGSRLVTLQHKRTSCCG